MNDQVGHVIADVMKDKAGVTITYLPSMIRVDADTRTDFVYDELAEALGEEPGSFTSADLEESMSTHYGRMVHEDDRTIMFANPEDAAQYIGFDLVPPPPAMSPRHGARLSDPSMTVAGRVIRDPPGGRFPRLGGPARPVRPAHTTVPTRGPSEDPMAKELRFGADARQLFRPASNSSPRRSRAPSAPRAAT